MARMWAERLAKRIGRLSQNLDQIEAKGRTSDKSYTRMLEELAEHCTQIIAASEAARHERDKARQDAIFSRRKVAEEWEAFKKERDEFRIQREQSLRSIREGKDDVKRQLDELTSERASLEQERDLTTAARQRYEQAVAIFHQGMAKV